MRKQLLFIAAAALSLAFAPAPFPRPGKRVTSESDLQRMQGTWVRVKLTIGGKPGVQNVAMTITGNRMQWPSPSDAWVIKLDPSKNPRTIDQHHANNENSVFRGVYRWDGDTLIICCRQNATEQTRPTDFDGSKPEVWYQVFKRQKR
jgi:uncharacterized protein (TIGR03067 family)